LRREAINLEKGLQKKVPLAQIAGLQCHTTQAKTLFKEIFMRTSKIGEVFLLQDINGNQSKNKQNKSNNKNHFPI